MELVGVHAYAVSSIAQQGAALSHNVTTCMQCHDSIGEAHRWASQIACHAWSGQNNELSVQGNACMCTCAQCLQQSSMLWKQAEKSLTTMAVLCGYGSLHGHSSRHVFKALDTGCTGHGGAKYWMVDHGAFPECPE